MNYKINEVVKVAPKSGSMNGLSFEATIVDIFEWEDPLIYLVEDKDSNFFETTESEMSKLN